MSEQQESRIERRKRLYQAAWDDVERVAAEVEAQRAENARLRGLFFRHVPSTHYLRECLLCGRQSYEDGTGLLDGIDHKPIHANWCELAALDATTKN